MRPDLRAADALRPVTIERRVVRYAEGSARVSFGDTIVLCTATVEPQVPPFLKGSGSGWVTAEYAMLPRSTHQRVVRDASKKGRALEISRLIGRSMRAVADLDAMGERQIILDCDVLQADGGTRTAAITGAWVAMYDAMTWMREQGMVTSDTMRGQCAGVSAGLIEGEALLDLCYEEDSAADVDINLVMRSDGAIIEVQGTAEGEAFPRKMLDNLLDLAESGCRRLFEAQRAALGIS